MAYILDASWITKYNDDFVKKKTAKTKKELFKIRFLWGKFNHFFVVFR